MSTEQLTGPPPTTKRVLLIVLALVALSIWALPIDLSAISSWTELQKSFGRLSDYLAAFTAPDLSSTMLSRCGELAIDTIAVALLGRGSGVGVLLAALALGALRSGSFAMDALGVAPRETASIVQGVVILVAAAVTAPRLGGKT